MTLFTWKVCFYNSFNFKVQSIKKITKKNKIANNCNEFFLMIAKIQYQSYSFINDTNQRKGLMKVVLNNRWHWVGLSHSYLLDIFYQSSYKLLYKNNKNRFLWKLNSKRYYFLVMILRYHCYWRNFYYSYLKD